VLSEGLGEVCREIVGVVVDGDLVMAGVAAQQVLPGDDVALGGEAVGVK
jgi:hypothetical protein